MKARAKSAGTMGHPGRPPAPRPVSPGQPENALPRWHHLPLDAKIPLPRVVPKGKAVMYPAKAGEPLWRTISPSLGLDLNDPLLMQLPGPHEYNPLHDPFSSGHLRRPDLQDAIYCHGLVTRHGFCLTSLKNFNRFRQYLHSVNLRHLKHKRTEVERPLRTEYEHLALDVVREERKKEDELQPETANEGGAALSARYSDIMRDEESKLPDLLPEFYSQLTDKEKMELNEENKNFATIRFAKIQNREARLAAIKSWLRKDGRKAALLRLRRLQIMEERRKKGINNWKTRTAVQSEFFEELRTRERRETEARRAHLAEKQQYQSVISYVHDVKYNEVVQRWRDKRLRSPKRAFCGYAHEEELQSTFIEPESNNEEEFADAEIQTDLKGGLTPQGETAAAAQSILIDRSIGLIEDITDGFSEEEVREYEEAARQLVESALYVHSEIILPAAIRYKAELERKESDVELDRGHDAAIQTSDSLQQMDPIYRRGDMSREPSKEEVLLQQDESQPETFGYTEHTGGLVAPEEEDADRSLMSSAASSIYKTEVVFSTVENEVIRVEQASEEPTDKVELLVVALDTLQKLSDSEDDSLDAHAGAICRLLVRGRDVLSEVIDIRRNSSLVVEEIVRLAIDDIAHQLMQETTTTDGKGKAEAENQSAATRRRGRRRESRRSEKASSSCTCEDRADLLTYIAGKAVAIIAHQAQDNEHRSGEGQSEVTDDGDDFAETFLRLISGGEEEAKTHRLSALVSACDDFNDALSDRSAWMDLSERESIQLARDRTTNEANRLVTNSVKKVLEDLGGEGLEMNDAVSYCEATWAIAEALLSLALHRDLGQLTKQYKDPQLLIDLVARIVRTHVSVRDSAAFAFRSAVGEHSSGTRWHLASILLKRLIKVALDRVTAEQRTCEMTNESLISLAAAINLKSLASNVVLKQPKKGRVRRSCPRQPPVIDQTKFRKAMIDSFTDKMKELVHVTVLPTTCVNHALSEAIQFAASTTLQHTTVRDLHADVKSIVAEAARVVIRRTVGQLASKFQARNDIQVESVLGQINSALADIDAYGLLSNESQLGLRARNSIELSRDRLREISPSTHWSPTVHAASDEEVNDRVTRKMSINSKVVRVTLVPTETDLIHEPYLPSAESVSPSPMPEAHAPIVIKTPHSSSAIDDLVDDLNVMPMFGNVPLDIDPVVVTEDLLVLSIKHDEDLDSPSLSMRNSFRNIHRPDVSGIRRFSSSSSVSGRDSIHDRVKGVFAQRRSTMEDDSTQRNIPRPEDDPEYVISRVTIPTTDSIPEFWPTEPGQSGDDAPIQSTVTTEYSKEYSFPEDMTPASGPEPPPFIRPDKAPDEISIISYLYGDPEEFHNLKISSTIIDDDEESPANDAPKKRDPALHIPSSVGSDGKPVPVEESDEVVITAREISNTIDLSRDASERFLSVESSNKRITGADGISEENTISMATDDHVTLGLKAAATELQKKDSNDYTSSKRLLHTSTDSVELPPVPTNSHESEKGGISLNASTSGVIPLPRNHLP